MELIVRCDNAKCNIIVTLWLSLSENKAAAGELIGAVTYSTPQCEKHT